MINDGRARERTEPTPGCWADGTPLTDREVGEVAQLREAGCRCEFPLIGYVIGDVGGRQEPVAPRCRACDTDGGEWT